MELPPTPPTQVALAVALATPRGARGWAGALGATATFVAFGGVHHAWSTTAWSTTGGVADADRLLLAVLGTVASALVALLGAELLWSAVAPAPTLHLTEHHLTLRMPALLPRPLVVARSAVASVRTVTGAQAGAAAGAGLVLLHGGALQVPHTREVLLLFVEPVVLSVRAAAWLRSRALPRLTDPLPAPGSRVTGLRLPAGEATAASWAAAAAWVPEEPWWLPVTRGGYGGARPVTAGGLLAAVAVLAITLAR